MGNVSRETTAEIGRGIKDTWAVGLGLVPLGLAFGLLMAQSGYAWWWTPIFSIVIYAGSMEFLAISLVAAGIGPLSAALTGLAVNFRHIFYGLTYPRENIRGIAGKAYSTYSLTDEAYAIVSTRALKERLSGARLLTIQLLCQTLWVVPGIIGSLAGALLPAGLAGMDFALTALFLVLAYESYRSSPNWRLPAVAGVLAVLSGLVAPGQLLLLALTIYFVFLFVRFRLGRG